MNTERPATFVDVAYGRLKYLLTTRYGNELSADHETVLRDGLIQLSAEMLAGRRSGRIAVGLPCGMGKTTAIRALIWATHKLNLPFTFTVACYRVEQLCGMVRQLSLPDTEAADGDGIPPEKLGLVHSYKYDARRAQDYIEGEAGMLPPDHASESSTGHDRQFLFVSHERIKSGEYREWMNRDCTFYDESLIVSEARVFTLLSESPKGLLAEVSQVSNLANYGNPEKFGEAAGWLTAVRDKLLDAMQAVKPSHGVHTLRLPELKPAVVNKLKTLLPDCRWPNIARLMELANEELRIRKAGNGSSLITYRLTVPEELTNVIITDASDPIRELVRYDKSIDRIEDVMPSLADYKADGIGIIKRYDNTTVYHMRKSGGREAMRKAFTAKAEANYVMNEVIKVLKEKPDEDFLILTYRERDGIDYIKKISRALEAAEIEMLHPDGCCRIHILTWGNETALNEYGHVRNVILAGVLLKPIDALAGELMGQSQNLRHADASNEPTLKNLQYSEACHSIYQAANRGAMRFTEVDADGQAQARPTNLYVLHYDGKLRDRLEKVMGGAKWLPWVPEDEAGSVYGTALLIENKLREYMNEGIAKVSVRKLKKELGIDLVGDNWVRARDTALEAVPWRIDGKSLQTLFS